MHAMNVNLSSRLLKKSASILSIVLIIILVVPLHLAFGQLVTIDAEKDAFFDGLTGPDDGYLQIRSFSYNTNGKPDNDADLSAKLWAAWDETYLYLYEEVKDNIVHLNNVTSWQDDVLEVYVDPDPSAAITSAQLGFHITALDSADADPAALAGVVNLAGYNLETGATTEDYARKLTDDGYVLECRVKWEVLKDATRAITPAVGNIFGMATMNHDNDVAQREGSVAWSAILNDNVWNTPANHGTVTFLADNKLQFNTTSTRSGLENDHPEWYMPNPEFSITIDGIMDPWYNALTSPDDGYVYIPARAFNTNGAPDNNKDLSALLWVAWDETYMYFYEEVADNVVNLNNPTSWQDDVLEVYFDPDPSAAFTQGQVGFSITALDTPDVEEANWPGIRNLVGYNLNTGATVEDYARVRTNDGYVLECRVKWDSLTADARGPIVPAPGNVFGLATMNHDNDVAQREGSVSWATVMNDNVWNTPGNHGTVEFLADHMLKLTAASARSGLVNDSAAVWYNPGVIIKVDVATREDDVPVVFDLLQNYPNPFNPTTTINYNVANQGRVKLVVYNVLGREVATLVDGVKAVGNYSVRFDASALSTGTYIYSLSVGDQVFTKKMMLLK